MQYCFDNDLKEKPENIDEFKKGIEFWKAALTDLGNLIDEAKLYSRIGVDLRIVGELDKSLKYLNKAKKILEKLPLCTIYLINKIRIAQTLQFLKQFEAANKRYNEIDDIIDLNSQFSGLRHFVYQHKGKNYFDQQLYTKAKIHFQSALKIRKQLDNQELIASSAFALKIIEERM